MAAKNTSSAKVLPVTAHPLFTPFVTLWFGALLGLGSLAVHPALLDNLLRLSRIEQLVATTLPPVDLTGRTLLALILAAGGCLIGLLVARTSARLVGKRRNQTGEDRVLVLPDELHAPFLAEADEDQPAVAAEEAAVALPAVEAAPVSEKPRPVLDISAVNLAPPQADEPLDLSGFDVEERVEEALVAPAVEAPTAAAGHLDRQPLPWPVQPSSDRAETERALRTALTNLQQLRGAA